MRSRIVAAPIKSTQSNGSAGTCARPPAFSPSCRLALQLDLSTRRCAFLGTCRHMRQWRLHFFWRCIGSCNHRVHSKSRNGGALCTRRDANRAASPQDGCAGVAPKCRSRRPVAFALDNSTEQTKRRSRIGKRGRPVRKRPRDRRSTRTPGTGIWLCAATGLAAIAPQGNGG